MCVYVCHHLESLLEKMTSLFTSISFINNAVVSEKFTTGSATCRINDDEFEVFRFKAFNYDASNLIQNITKDKISLIVGRLAVEDDEINVSANEQFSYFSFN